MSLAIFICSKNPRKSLLNNISKLIEFYTFAKIVIIDSDSSFVQIYSRINEMFKDVDILYCKNKNFEIGAWKCGYKHYPNFEMYMCIQDSLFIKSKINISKDHAYILKEYVGFKNCKYYKHKASELFKNSVLYDTIVAYRRAASLTALHTSFIVNNANLKEICDIFEHYIDDDKSVSHITERLIGMFFLYKKIDPIDIKYHFDKIHYQRC